MQSAFLRLYITKYNCAVIPHQPWNILWFQNPIHSPHGTQYINLTPDFFEQIACGNIDLLQRERLRNMDALNWATGARPNRPFQNLNPQPIYHNHNVHAFHPRRPRLNEQVEATKYLNEQRFLARDEFGEDPFAHHEADEKPCENDISVPLLDATTSVVQFLLNGIFAALCWSIMVPFKAWSHLAKCEWDMVLMFVVAAYIAKWLPGMGGTALKEISEEVGDPVYIMNLPAGYVYAVGSNLGNSVQ